MGALTLLALLGLTLGVGRFARIEHAQAVFLTTSLVILTLYVGSLAEILWWTALAVHLAGIALLGLAALQLARKPSTGAIPLPIGVLALLCAWFLLIHGGDQYFLYDEFAHWGIYIKEMLALDGLWGGETNAMHPRYPPAAPLWQYLFSAFLPPSEARTYFAHFVLLLAPLLVLWNGLRWRQSAWTLAILLLVLVALANFGLGVSTLYVDQHIGAWFLGTLLAAMADRDLASTRIALYALPLAVIALLKDVGLAFAVAGAIILATLFCHRALASRRRGTALRQTGAAVAVLLAPALLCMQVWSWNRDAAGAAQDPYSVGGIVSGIAKQAAGSESAIDIEIARRLREVFFDQQLSNSAVSWEHNEFTYEIRGLFTDSFRLTTFHLFLLFVFWWVAVAFGVLTAESRTGWLILAAGMLVTASGYVGLLHLSYRFAFDDRGLDLPSYIRYVHVVALPMLLLSFGPLLPAFRERRQDGGWRIRGRFVPQRAALFAAALATLCALETPYLSPILHANPAVPRRASVEPLLVTIRAAVADSRLWIYFPGAKEADFFGRMAQYLLIPTRATVEDAERFLQAEDADTIAAAWRPFDYVWIAEIPSVEAGIGLARFSAGTARTGLYRVQRSDKDEVRLEPLQAQ
jgi:hypothetical protein